MSFFVSEKTDANPHVNMPPVEPTVEYIKELVPLRFPVLLVDRVLEWIPGERITAIKAFTVNESFFGTEGGLTPCPPEPLVIESMVQVAGLTLSKREGKYIFLLGLDKIELHRPVRYGDCVTTKAEKLYERRSMFRVVAESTVDGEKVASGEITYVYLDSPAGA